MPLNILGEGVSPSNFTARQALFVHNIALGLGVPNSTPPLDSGDSDTYRFALRMPTIGKLTRVVINYASGSGDLKLDFRMYASPFNSERLDNDLIYERTRIDKATVWDHDFGDKPVSFANRVGHETERLNPRNFLWIEAKPSASADSVVYVDLYFEV